MLTVRCDSCGALLVNQPYYQVQFWPQALLLGYDAPAQQPPFNYFQKEVCLECATDFTSGKMHAEATTYHV